jgi:IS30 family transposase
MSNKKRESRGGRPSKYNLEVIFCDPHAPWQRGAIENFNGHVRFWLPRGQRLDTLTPTQSNAAASPTS